MVEGTEGQEVPDGKLVGGAFVAGVHGLGGAQKLGDLFLGIVVVFPEVSDSFHVGHLFHKNSPIASKY